MRTDQRQRCARLQLRTGDEGFGRDLLANNAVGNGLRLYGYVVSGETGFPRSLADGDL